MKNSLAAIQGRPRTRRATRTLQSADPNSVDDVLIFERTDRGFALVGGTGRGAGWAGIVELAPADEALIGRAWGRGTAERISASRPVQIAGPYYARHAVAVPVGQRHVVVFGDDRPIAGRDTDLVRRAAAAVDGADGVPADKLLADELELVQALRLLMAYRPLTVRDTIRHIATVAGQALSCEVAVMRVELEGQIVVEGLDLRSMSALARPDAGGSLAAVDHALGSTIQQVAPPFPDLFGLEVASHLTVPLGGEATGALALGHTIARARGFTSLCQRIGRAVADAAELLVSQAHAREQLASERDLLARLVRIDALTGGANRRAWEDEVAAWSLSPVHGEAFVMSCDLDGLKAINDRYGHATGDALIRGASNLLRSCVRESDLVARVGGDEFVVLLNPADAVAARRTAARVRRAQRAWRIPEHGLVPQLSVGLAPVVCGDLEGARAVADQAMYASKRRRSSGEASPRGRGTPDRRAASRRGAAPDQS